LYAAELDEPSLEPHILNQSFSVKKHDAGDTPGCAPKDAPIGRGTTKSLEHQAK
jgi:hypothetical protein